MSLCVSLCFECAMPSVDSGYTFEDFLKRLERSPTAHMSPLYHEHRELFVRRPDMFSRAVRSITWEKGCAMVGAAYHSQPIALDTYRALLARMLLHNRFVQRSGSGRFVPWSLALRTYSEAILTHGNAVPTRMTRSTLRLLASHRQWTGAIALLKLSQANGKMTLPMLVDAADCCATVSTWRTAMTLLGLVHKQSPDVLVDSIQSLRPLGTNATAAAAAVNALLPDNGGPTVEQKHVLAVLNDVVASVPWETALSNEMCVSYITHLAASTSYSPQEKTKALTTSTRLFPWEAFVRLMAAGNAPTLTDLKGSTALLEAAEEKKSVKESELSLLNLPAVKESLRLLENEPDTAVPFLAAIVEKLPSAEAAEAFLTEAAAMHRDTVAAATLRHPLVVGALLRKCSQQQRAWQLASSVLLSMAPGPLPCDVASALVLQMREAKQTSLVVEILQKFFVPAKVVLTREAMEALLACVLAHNRAVAVSSSRTAEQSQVSKRMIGSVHWLSALSWATDLLQEDVEGRILQTGSAVSSAGVNYGPPKVVPRLKPLSSRILSLLIYICVNADSPQGALRAMGYARTVNKMELALSEEIQALLYCMMYDRPYEATAIVREAEKKHGSNKAQYLERLLLAIQEAKGA